VTSAYTKYALHKLSGS